MKKIYIISLLSIFSMNLYCQIHWAKHPDNPVLEPGVSGAWDYGIIAPGSVIYHGNAYHMWYWGGNLNDYHFRIGHATSPDGINWTKDINNPVLDIGPVGTWDANFVNEPTVLIIDTIFHMWYAGDAGPEKGTNVRIGHATSPDGINWTKDTNNPVLDIGPVGTWDNSLIAMPSVIFNGSEYHIWYTGSDGFNIRIGHATSPDGITWTKDPQNPVLNYGSGSWDSPRVDYPEVVFDGTKYHMWYSGGEFGAWQIGYASSENGSSWEKDLEFNPVLQKGSAGSWDGMNAAMPAILDSADIKYKMWYCGSDVIVSSSIGYAELDVGARVENYVLSGLSIYPNPTNEVITIETTNSGYHIIKITSLNGQILKTLKMEGITHQLDLSSFQKGVYFITVRSRDQVWTEKIIKL